MSDHDWVQEDVRALDETLVALFKPVRPGPTLEDRMIRSLRLKSLRRWRWPFPAPMAVGAAAVVLLGVVGAVLSRGLEEGVLSFPGGESGRARSENRLRELAVALSDEESGLRSKFGSYSSVRGLVREDASQLHGVGGDVSAPQDVEQMARQLREKVLDLPVARSGDSRELATDLGRPQSTPNQTARPEGAGENRPNGSLGYYRSTGPQTQPPGGMPQSGGGAGAPGTGLA